MPHLDTTPPPDDTVDSTDDESDVLGVVEVAEEVAVADTVEVADTEILDSTEGTEGADEPTIVAGVTTDRASSHAPLPRTGGSSGMLALIGLMALTLGGAILRRRPTSTN